MRTRTLLLLATTLTLACIAGAEVAIGGDVSEPARGTFRLPMPAATRALAVLHAWDRRRSAAWASADPGALADLYTVRSRTGAQDVHDLRHWRSRGLRVVGLRQQVAALRVQAETKRGLVVTVTDRTVDGLAVGHHRRTALPRSNWMRHRIRLRREQGGWVVAEVVAQPAR
jgi:hypothetical protein